MRVARFVFGQRHVLSEGASKSMLCEIIVTWYTPRSAWYFLFSFDLLFLNVRTLNQFGEAHVKGAECFRFQINETRASRNENIQPNFDAALTEKGLLHR